MVIKQLENFGLKELMSSDSTSFSITSVTDNALTLNGKVILNATTKECGAVNDTYSLEITIPVNFPREIPTIKETGNRIPRDANHHINQSDDTMCLGSPITILEKISEQPTLPAFIHKCIIPFLYSISVGQFLWGELAHGYRGIFDDYKEKFDLNNDTQIIEILYLLSKKKRLANKCNCPCGCGQRLGKCKLHLKVNEIRQSSSRKNFKNALTTITKEIVFENRQKIKSESIKD